MTMTWSGTWGQSCLRRWNLSSIWLLQYSRRSSHSGSTSRLGNVSVVSMSAGNLRSGEHTGSYWPPGLSPGELGAGARLVASPAILPGPGDLGLVWVEVSRW